ncbi:hypothetical protein A5814_002783 [Enterococcus faecium]|nr:hypothetical protein A5814_002783 [Enterococcus faecium]
MKKKYISKVASAVLLSQMLLTTPLQVLADEQLSTPTSQSSTMNNQFEESDRIKELEKQVRALQIENAFLKELRKLRKQETQQRRMKQLHESFQGSEDHLN